ncbi:MAG: Stp1/IreP family PP2C-type Ser/Thr phosphatase [Oscillospiraceae bacterium]|nr:Stp1/IreP family PP2C-type Ser/Thr phosphatase [Oscillospiraceae bacterium]
MMNVYYHTDIGNARSENQDSFASLVLEDALFATVCDGMGGSNAGSEASRRTADLIADKVQKTYSTQYDANHIRNMLIAAVQTANAVVYDLGLSVPEWEGMGTTCVAAFVRGNTAHVVNVGDSRLYLVSHEITQVTKDHSMVMRMYENGDITRDQIKNHPKRNVITRAVGVAEDVDPDYFEVEMPEGSALLLCSDGLYNYCDEGVMFYTVKHTDPELVPEKLVKTALENNGSDNITAMLIK